MSDFPDREGQWAQREELKRAWAIVDNQAEEIAALNKALVEVVGILVPRYDPEHPEDHGFTPETAEVISGALEGAK